MEVQLFVYTDVRRKSEKVVFKKKRLSQDTLRTISLTF